MPAYGYGRLRYAARSNNEASTGLARQHDSRVSCGCTLQHVAEEKKKSSPALNHLRRGFPGKQRCRHPRRSQGIELCGWGFRGTSNGSSSESPYKLDEDVSLSVDMEGAICGCHARLSTRPMSRSVIEKYDLSLTAGSTASSF